MPTVTALKPQKNNKRVNVYLDGVFSFGIDLDNLVLSGIKISKEYSTDQINKIIRKAEFQKTLDKLIRFATLRPRSEYEINQWLTKKQIADILHQDLKNRLIKLELIDDQNFAKWWTDQRRSFRLKGNRAIAMELKQKGVSEDIIRSVVSDSEENEIEIAKKLLAKKTRKWKKLDLSEKRKKQSEFLVRNGFEWNAIKEVVE